MASQELINYIQETLDNGFSEDQVRAALLDAGWEQSEIEQGFATLKSGSSLAADITSGGAKAGFFSRYRKLLITSFVVVVLIPVLTYLALLLYQGLTGEREPETETTQEAEQPTPPAQNQLLLEQQEQEEAAERDLIRLQDIQTLQEALSVYFETNAFYPQNLSELVETGLIPRLSLDPKTDRPYLYTPLGDPALFYSMSFLLETDVGTLSEGLQTVTSDTSINASLIQFQERTVQGAVTEQGPSPLPITDLSQVSFFPGEEALLEVVHDPAIINLKNAVLVTDWLTLTDNRSPFRFYFSVPAEPGIYTVEVFGFDDQNASYSATTHLKVE